MFQTWSPANHLIAQLANDLECISHVPSKVPPFSITTTVTTPKPPNFWPKRMFKQTNSHNFAWVACHSCHKVNTKVNDQSRQNNSLTRYQRILLGGTTSKLMIFGLWVYICIQINKDIYIYTLGAGGSPGTPAPRGFIYMKLGWGWGGVGWGW